MIRKKELQLGLTFLEKYHKLSFLSVSWNYDGSLLATTCKDKALRIIDPRTAEVIEQRDSAHDGTKTCKCIFLKDGRIMTFGFSRMSDRQYALLERVLIRFSGESLFWDLYHFRNLVKTSFFHGTVKT